MSVGPLIISSVFIVQLSYILLAHSTFLALFPPSPPKNANNAKNATNIYT